MLIDTTDHLSTRYQNLINFTENRINLNVNNSSFIELNNLNIVFFKLKLQNIDFLNFNVVGSTYKALSIFQDMDEDIIGLLKNIQINHEFLFNFL